MRLELSREACDRQVAVFDGAEIIGQGSQDLGDARPGRADFQPEFVPDSDRDEARAPIPRITKTRFDEP